MTNKQDIKREREREREIEIEERRRQGGLMREGEEIRSKGRRRGREGDGSQTEKQKGKKILKPLQPSEERLKNFELTLKVLTICNFKR